VPSPARRFAESFIDDIPMTLVHGPAALKFRITHAHILRSGNRGARLGV
jgi:hypothetical protein